MGSDCIRLYMGSDCILVIAYLFTFQRLKHKLLRSLVHGVRQNHVATYIRWHVCLCMFEFVPETLTFIYTFRPGNIPKSMA